LDLAREFGASRVLNYHQLGKELTATIREQIHDPFPTVIEASGSPTAAHAALDLVAHQGTTLILGDYGKGRTDFPWNHILLREIHLMGSNASAGAWPEAVRLAVGARLPLDRLITHRLPADRFHEGFDLMRSRHRDVIKVVLVWQ